MVLVVVVVVVGNSVSVWVGDLKKGIYKYIPEYHSLKLIRLLDGDFNINNIAQMETIDTKNINLYVLYVYKLYENSRKYGDNGMAFGFIEVGQLSEHIHLATTSMGLGSCDIGGFSKQKIETLIGLDGLSCHIIHSTIIGAL